MKLKAYLVRDKDRDSEVCVLVAAFNAGRARTLAHSSEWLEGFDFIELRATREFRADSWAKTCSKETLADGSQKSDSILFRELGWYELEGSYERCGSCDLYEWSNLPESLLKEEGEEMLCGECRKKSTQEK